MSYKILNTLFEQKNMRLSGGIYHKTQIELTYNSNHIEGNQLSHDQVMYIFETNTIWFEHKPVNVDDVIETVNHFRCIDFIIDNALEPLSEDLIKQIHFILKSNTSDSKKEWFSIGDYKKYLMKLGVKKPVILLMLVMKFKN